MEGGGGDGETKQLVIKMDKLIPNLCPVFVYGFVNFR